ncbi:MAG TPA: ABC transporter ATP-binding protein [Terriglobales bacterium]|nr:ABC transporter ATP-binding protein [Terriglobales bacterium]
MAPPPPPGHTEPNFYWQFPLYASLLSLSRGHRRWIAAACALGALVAAAGACEPLFLEYLTDLLVNSAGIKGSAVHAAFYHGCSALALLGAVLLAGRTLQTAQALAVNRVRFDSSFELSVRVLRRIYERPLSFHQQSGAGYVMARMDRGVAALGQLTGDLLSTLIPNLINLALMLWLLARLSPPLALVAVAPMPAFLYATVRGARRLARHEEVVQTGWSRLYGRVTEVLGGIKTVKSMAGEEAEVAEYRRQARPIFTRLWRLLWVEQGYGHLTNLWALSGRLGVAGYGFWLVLGGRITPGAWIAAASFAALLYGPLAGLAGSYTGLARQWVAAEAVLRFLDEPASAAPPAAAARLPRLRGAVAFDRVSFAYEGAAQPAIDDISFRLEPGEHVAIVGPSGGGKTTLMDLLLRFHDPAAGRITLDGRDLRTLAPAALRRQMAVVLQEPFLLEGTIAENLAYGCPDPRLATPERIAQALEAAQAAEFVNRLPLGAATRLGERGARLSGGEKQRLAIARALLRDPRILILDEATAHLDAASESALNCALRHLLAGRTALIISHRLQTMLPTDRILVIAAGRIRQQGTPAALAAAPGFYADWLQPHPAAI